VYLSDQGLEHGLLTSSNVLVSQEGVVKIGVLGAPLRFYELTAAYSRL
jgi:hypothetical protein